MAAFDIGFADGLYHSHWIAFVARFVCAGGVEYKQRLAGLLGNSCVYLGAGGAVIAECDQPLQILALFDLFYFGLAIQRDVAD